MDRFSDLPKVTQKSLVANHRVSKQPSKHTSGPNLRTESFALTLPSIPALPTCRILSTALKPTIPLTSLCIYRFFQSALLLPDQVLLILLHFAPNNHFLQGSCPDACLPQIKVIGEVNF